MKANDTNLLLPPQQVSIDVLLEKQRGGQALLFAYCVCAIRRLMRGRQKVARC